MKTEHASAIVVYAVEDPSVLEEIRYLAGSLSDYEQTHILAWIGDIIVGDAAVRLSPYREAELWLMHLAVREGFRHRGIGRKLAQAVHAHAKETGVRCVRVSTYSESSDLYLKPSIDALEGDDIVFLNRLFHLTIRLAVRHRCRASPLSRGSP